MESKFPELLDARGDQVAMEVKSPRNQGLLHSDVDYILATNILFTFIYELIGQELTDNVYINIHACKSPEGKD